MFEKPQKAQVVHGRTLAERVHATTWSPTTFLTMGASRFPSQVRNELEEKENMRMARILLRLTMQGTPVF
jgi:hypothetical protein